MEKSTNRRMAKNAIALTFRMILSAIIGLYTSRLVLEALGVDDYGIYGAVGGVIGMISFLNSSMAGATSRFITYELGKGNKERLKLVFSTAFVLHLCIALIVVVFGETIGLWFLNNKMVFPEDRMFAVNFLYQVTIAAVVLGVTQVPYLSDILAHEKMNIYAYLEVVHVILKLLMVYVLFIADTDRLILYSCLSFSVGFLNAMFYRIYCITHYDESKLSFKVDKSIMKDMIKFSGSDLYGNVCVVAKNQGQPIMLNMFFGVLANAGASIALTVTGTINGLIYSISQAFRPQIIKTYANDDLSSMVSMMRRCVQFSIIAYAAIAIPFVMETERILYLWLGQVPPYSVIFLRLVMVSFFVNLIVNTNIIATQATGNIKRVSLFNGTLHMLCPILAYFFYKAGFPAATMYVLNIILMLVIAIVGFFILKAQIQVFPLRKYVWPILNSCTVTVVSMIAVIIFKYFVLPEACGYESLSFFGSLLVVCVITIVGILSLFVLSYAFTFSTSERELVKEKLRKMLCFA